jgi:hypothetical protein
MKKIIFVVILITTTYGLWFYIVTRINVVNSEKISIGDTKNRVIEIMGEPKSVVNGSLLTDSIKTILFFYEPPFGASEGIDIYIDIKADTTVKITHYEEETRYIKPPAR